MYDDLHALFEEGVGAAYVEYLDAKKEPWAGRSVDLRRAINAATLLFHFREHLPPSLQPSMQDVIRDCPDYSLLRDVVDSAKHSRLRDSSRPVREALQIEELAVRTEYRDEQGAYAHIDKLVVAQLSDGAARDLLGLMTSVMNYWSDFLFRAGILAANKKWPYPLESEPRPRGACNNGELGMRITKGLRFSQKFQLLRFNYTTNVAEPVELTGWQARGRLYAPSYEFVLTATENGSGREIEVVVKLTAEESRVIAEMENDDDRRAYVFGLEKTKAALEELKKRAESAGDAPLTTQG